MGVSKLERRYRSLLERVEELEKKVRDLAPMPLPPLPEEVGWTSPEIGRTSPIVECSGEGTTLTEEAEPPIFPAPVEMADTSYLLKPSPRDFEKSPEAISQSSPRDFEREAFEMKESGMEWGEIGRKLDHKAPWFLAGRYKKRLQRENDE